MNLLFHKQVLGGNYTRRGTMRILCYSKNIGAGIGTE
jgi:hypothetical protein